VHKIIGIQDLEQRFRSVLEEVSREQVPYILTRGDRPEAALVPYPEFLRVQEFQENEILSRFDRLRARMAMRSAGFSDEEVAADIAAARRERAG
jgi:prevent-host-death family protein